MRNFHKTGTALLLLIAAAGCATPYTGPVDVTRFVATDVSEQLGRGSVAVVLADGISDTARSAAYKEAVEAELLALGYIVNPAHQADQRAIVSVEKSQVSSEQRRSPVNVGVGGSTGSYGTGVGLGIGINLGGGKKPRNATTLSVRISADQTLWEGRAELITSTDAALASNRANAQILARGLFQDFPGGNGETLSIDTANLQEAP